MWTREKQYSTRFIWIIYCRRYIVINIYKRYILIIESVYREIYFIFIVKPYYKIIITWGTHTVPSEDKYMSRTIHEIGGGFRRALLENCTYLFISSAHFVFFSLSHTLHIILSVNNHYSNRMLSVEFYSFQYRHLSYWVSYSRLDTVGCIRLWSSFFGFSQCVLIKN